jgi:hypothetical protein
MNQHSESKKLYHDKTHMLRNPSIINKISKAIIPKIDSNIVLGLKKVSDEN